MPNVLRRSRRLTDLDRFIDDEEDGLDALRSYLADLWFRRFQDRRG
jgi:hypothetical protein